MIIIFWAIAFATAFIEILIHRTFQPDNFEASRYSNWLTRKVFYKLHNLGPYVEERTIRSVVFSVIISFALAAIFPAAGVIIFAAGIFSTIITQPYYSAIRMGRRTRTRFSNFAAQVQTNFRRFHPFIRTPH